MVCQFRLVLEDLVTVIERNLQLSVDTPHVEVHGVFRYELPSTDIANKFTNHFDEISGVLLLLGRAADTDLPAIAVGFRFEKLRNCLQNGTQNPPHAAHLFWPKKNSVLSQIGLKEK